MNNGVCSFDSSKCVTVPDGNCSHLVRYTQLTCGAHGCSGRLPWSWPRGRGSRIWPRLRLTAIPDLQKLSDRQIMTIPRFPSAHGPGFEMMVWGIPVAGWLLL